MRSSRYSLEARKAYALKFNLGGGWLTNSADGRYDNSIDFELKRSKTEAAATENRADARDVGGVYRPDVHTKGAAQAINSILQVPGCDRAAVIEKECDERGVDEAGRTYLRTKFLDSAPASVAASA